MSDRKYTETRVGARIDAVLIGCAFTLSRVFTIHDHLAGRVWSARRVHAAAPSVCGSGGERAHGFRGSFQ
jgi:hypothetical protein